MSVGNSNCGAKLGAVSLIDSGSIGMSSVLLGSQGRSSMHDRSNPGRVLRGRPLPLLGWKLGLGGFLGGRGFRSDSFDAGANDTTPFS